MRNVLERALIIARGLPADYRRAHLASEVRAMLLLGEGGWTIMCWRTLADVERQHIDRTLRAVDWNRTRAAKELGISRATLIKKIRDYGMDNRTSTAIGVA